MLSPYDEPPSRRDSGVCPKWAHEPRRRQRAHCWINRRLRAAPSRLVRLQEGKHRRHSGPEALMTKAHTLNPPTQARMAGLKGLHAYQVALEFYRRLNAALENTARDHLRTQLLRAAESVALNVAEAHPTVGADRARRFRIAANEASECSAALDLLEIRGSLDGETLRALRLLLDRERAMLWRLGRKR